MARPAHRPSCTKVNSIGSCWGWQSSVIGLPPGSDPPKIPGTRALQYLTWLERGPEVGDRELHTAVVKLET